MREGAWERIIDEEEGGGQGNRPPWRTCASHSDPAMAGFGSGDSLSKCPMNPGEMAWEQMQDGSGKVSRHSTMSEGPAVLGIAGTELAEHPQMGRQTLQCVSLDSPCLYVSICHFLLPTTASSTWTPAASRGHSLSHTHAPALGLLGGCWGMRHAGTCCVCPRVTQMC